MPSKGVIFPKGLWSGLLSPLRAWLLICCHTGATEGFLGGGCEGSIVSLHSAQNPPTSEQPSLLS